MSNDDRWPIFISPQQLHENLAATEKTPVLIWDLSTPETYAEHHLPNAAFVNFADIRCGEPPITGLLPSKAQLSQVFSHLGLTDETQVVLYDDDGGGKSGRMAWTLDVIGHHDYSVLDGGLLAWQAEGYPLSQTPFTPEPSDYSVTYITDELIAHLEWLMKHYDSPQLAIWDARSPQEFDGSLARANKAGHIPGAKNYEWTRAMRLEHFKELRPLEDIRNELADLGITYDKTIVTHCQTHHRSGFTYLLGKALGFKDIRAYPGSWSEWGNHPDTPVKK